MVVERTTRNRYNAGRVGGRAPRGTSKKGKQQEDSSESSEADTKAETSVARTQKTLKGAELKATEMFLQAREYLDSDQVTAIIHQYANTRRELGLITRAQIADEILTGKGAIKGRKISSLQESKISLLLTEIETYLRGEFKWEADGDVYWNT